MGNKIFNTGDGYTNVRVGILQRAIKDYKRALRREDKGTEKHLERWFLSEWGQFLSGNTGEKIIIKARKEVKK